jgi:hypothetical protein
MGHDAGGDYDFGDAVEEVRWHRFAELPHHVFEIG